MEIIKNKENVLLKNSLGEYHLSIEKYEELGEQEAIIFAEKEINKKLNSSYNKKEINFQEARLLGFCEYGIRDFCEKLNLDTKKSYEISYLSKKVSIEVFSEYSSECLKLFGKSILENFGGAKKFLDENRTRDNLNIIFNNSFISDEILHQLSVKFAYSSLENFEKIYPDDKRPRNAIEAKEKFLRNEISKEELEKARSAAESAAWSAIWSAAEVAAESAADSAAESAAESAAWSARSAAESAAWSAESAAWSAARSAAWSAAWSAESAEISKQIDLVLEYLK